MVPPSGKGLADPHSRLARRRSSGARRRRGREPPFLPISGRVISSIANRLPLFIKELQGLLKQPRRWCARRHGRLEDVETGAMPVDRREGTRSIGVGELQPMSLDHVRDIPRVMGNLGIPLKEFPRCVDNRSLHINPPVVLTRVALSPVLPALLDSRGVYSFGVLVIDHGDGVAVRAILDAIDAPR